jgi:hypothetical protein
VKRPLDKAHDLFVNGLADTVTAAAKMAGANRSSCARSCSQDDWRGQRARKMAAKAVPEAAAPSAAPSAAPAVPAASPAHSGAAIEEGQIGKGKVALQIVARAWRISTDPESRPRDLAAAAQALSKVNDLLPSREPEPGKRYRQARAKRMELETAKMRRELIPVGDVQEAARILSAELDRAIARIRATPDGHAEIVIDAVAEVNRIVGKRFPAVDGGRDGVPDADAIPGADATAVR